MQNEIWDTSVYIYKLRSGFTWSPQIPERFFLSSVVAAELITGYTAKKDKFIHFRNYFNLLRRLKKVINPRSSDWFLSGVIIGKIVSRRPDLKSKRALLFNDCLIATTSTLIKARILTANRSDFELIKKYFDFDVEFIS